MLDIDYGDISNDIQGIIDDRYAGETFIAHQSESIGQGFVTTRSVSSKQIIRFCFGRLIS
jgi:hypothetical protein